MSAPLKPTRDLRFAWVSGALVVGVALFAWFVLRPLDRTPIDPRIGVPAADFALPVIRGGAPNNRIRLSELRGRVVVLDFFASWCVPCEAAAAEVAAVAESRPEDQVVILGVATADTASAAAAFAAAHAPLSVAVHDADGSVAANFGATDLPTLVVIDRRGIIAAIVSGVVPRAELEQLIAGADPG